MNSNYNVCSVYLVIHGTPIVQIVIVIWKGHHHHLLKDQAKEVYHWEKRSLLEEEDLQVKKMNQQKLLMKTHEGKFNIIQYIHIIFEIILAAIDKTL